MLTDIEQVLQIIRNEQAGIRPDLDCAKGIVVVMGESESSKPVVLCGATLLRDQTKEIPPCES